MTRNEAEKLLVDEWKHWRRNGEFGSDQGEYADVVEFYGHLRDSRTDLLEFRFPGDKLQIVYGWLRARNLAV